MTYLRVALMGLMITAGTQAAQADAACYHSCFDQQRSCSAQAHAFTGHQECSREQEACRFSCNSGKKMKDYRELSEMRMSFRPVLDKFFKKL